MININGTLYLIAMPTNAALYPVGYKWTGSTWISNTTIVNGLSSGSNFNSFRAFNYSNSFELYSIGDYGWDVKGYSWNGSWWVQNASLINNIVSADWTCSFCVINIFNLSGTKTLIAGNEARIIMETWNGTAWNYNTSGTNDLGIYGQYRWASGGLFETNNLNYITSYNYTTPFSYVGWSWNGTNWTQDISLVSGLINPTDISVQSVVEYNGYIYLVNGKQFGLWEGYRWGNYNITLNSPSDNSAINKTYPPLTSSVVFNWTSVNTPSPAYHIVVAKDISFNLISLDTVVSTNTTTLSLEAGNYWWKVQYYDSTYGTYEIYSNVSNFTLSNIQTISGTNIQGTVYEVIAGTITPISNARVFISNNESTWSSDMVTGSTGYFLFSGLTNSTTYNLRATRSDLYQNSVLYYVTTGAGTTTTQNILMEKCVSSQDCYFGTIDQSIMFQSYNATTHVTSFLSGYTVNIYEDGAVVPLYTLTTDKYGVVIARLTTTKRYQISIHDGDGVNMITNVADRNIYPRGDGIVITIETGTSTAITYPTNTSVTNTTNRTGATGCGISCYNSSYLTSTTGIGPLGQGVLTSIIVWVVYGVGGAITVLFTVGILAWLGIISWYMVFLFVITGMSIYVLKEM